MSTLDLTRQLTNAGDAVLLGTRLASLGDAFHGLDLAQNNLRDVCLLPIFMSHSLRPSSPAIHQAHKCMFARIARRLTRCFNTHFQVGVVGVLGVLSQPYVGAQLRFLGLSRNGIGDRGAVAVAEHLSTSATPLLEHTELRDNGIGDIGALALAHALQHTRNLRQ